MSSAMPDGKVLSTNTFRLKIAVRSMCVDLLKPNHVALGLSIALGPRIDLGPRIAPDNDCAREGRGEESTRVLRLY